MVDEVVHLLLEVAAHLGDRAAHAARVYLVSWRSFMSDEGDVPVEVVHPVRNAIEVGVTPPPAQRAIISGDERMKTT